MARVLVVGGAGYIGGALTDRLMGTCHNVRVYDSLLYEDSYRKPVDFVMGDVRDRGCLRPQLKWADAVVWLAALVGDGACSLNPDLTVEVNELSVKRLVEEFDGRAIFMSTCSVYGAQDGILDENSALNPLSLYAATKLRAETYLRERNALLLRLATLFGVGDHFSRIRLDLVVNVLTVKACLYNRISVFGGDQYRPLLHVKDVAEQIVRALDTDRTGIYNLHAVNVRIADLAETLLTHFPGLQIQQTEMKFQDSRNYRVSSAKAMHELGFKPKYSVDDGIRELKALLDERRIKSLTLPRHSNQRFLRDFLQTPSSPIGFEVRSGI